jgi:hypothetical protein
MTGMKEVIHTVLCIFYFTFLFMEIIVILLVSDLGLVYLLALVNYATIISVYYFRYTSTKNKRRLFFSWYIFIFASIDSLFYLLILSFLYRTLTLLILCLLALLRLVREFGFLQCELTTLLEGHVKHHVIV